MAALRASRVLGLRLFVREIRSQYRKSALGYLWILIPVAAQTMLWIFLNESNILNTGDTGIPYVVFVVTGVLIWQGFLDALLSPQMAMRDAAPLLTRLSFPAESLLVSAMAVVLLNTLVRLVALALVLVAYDVQPSWSLLLAPIGVLVVLLFGFSIGLLLAPFGVLYEDINRGILVATMFLWLVTPVAYEVPTTGIGRLIGPFNPLAPLVTSARSWITGGPLQISTGFVVVAIFSIVALGVAWVVFRVSIPHLVDRIGN